MITPKITMPIADVIAAKMRETDIDPNIVRDLVPHLQKNFASKTLVPMGVCVAIDLTFHDFYTANDYPPMMVTLIRKEIPKIIKVLVSKEAHYKMCITQYNEIYSTTLV